jgi:3-dehydroquinate synthase
MNFVDGGRYIKHYYKSFYEPNNIIIDFDFLKTLKPKQISIGLAEPIKHAFAQSPKFVKYLQSDSFDPFKKFEDLKRAIVWTIDLKKICLTVDPEESTNGSHKVIHLAHDYSNKIEEDSEFKVSHGEAVERGLVKEFSDDPKRLTLLKSIYNKLSIATT